GNTGLNHDISFVIDDHVQFLGWKTQKITDFVRQRTEIPDMSHRNYQADVAVTLSTYFFLGNFYTTTVANDSFVSDSLVFTASTFVILHRTEDFLAEQAVTFRFVGSVVNGFGL